MIKIRSTASKKKMMEFLLLFTTLVTNLFLKVTPLQQHAKVNLQLLLGSTLTTRVKRLLQ